MVANFAERVGGGEESLLLLARGLDRGRFAPSALVPAEGEVASELRACGLPVAVQPLPTVRPWALPAMLAARAALRARLVASRVALIHAHGSRGALYAGLAARGLGMPLVWHARIAERDRWLDPILLRLSDTRHRHLRRGRRSLRRLAAGRRACASCQRRRPRSAGCRAVLRRRARPACCCPGA